MSRALSVLACLLLLWTAATLLGTFLGAVVAPAVICEVRTYRFISSAEGATFSTLSFPAAYAEDLSACRANVERFDDLPEGARLATLDLVYTVGPTGFTRFTGYRAALSHRLFTLASFELADSRWATQVAPSRVARDYALVRDAASSP